MAQKFRDSGIGELKIKTLPLILEFLNSQSLKSGLSGLSTIHFYVKGKALERGSNYDRIR